MKEKEVENKKEDTRPISYNQIKYLKRLIRNSAERTRDRDMEEYNVLKAKIEEIGVDKLTLKVARGYIATLVKFEKLYQEEKENEVGKIENSAKIIDFSKYRKI
ncbi:MAG: hypothetical protein RSG48_06380 [Clostridia bacterium]